MGLTAMSRGHERCSEAPGGKSWSAGASLGGGTGITPVRVATPVFGSYRRTWITSPCRPGVLGSAFSPVCDESATPETYAVRPSPDIAIPPLRPGNGIVCTTRPTCLPARRLHFFEPVCFASAADPFLPFFLQGILATWTIRTSLRPRPVERAQRKRPLVVRAPPVGRLPSGVSLPSGSRWRPDGWIPVAGPITPTEP